MRWHLWSGNQQVRSPPQLAVAKVDPCPQTVRLFITPNCELCSIQRTVERRVADEFLRGTPATGLPTVCLPHVRWLSAYVSDPSVTAQCRASHDGLWTLLRRQAAAAERLAEDMQRYVLKRDANRRALVTDEEAQAAHRAIAFLSGARHVLIR
jgi:hypothetical protein